MAMENKQTENKADIKEALMNLLHSSSSGGNQFVTFNIATEEYGINIKSVQEITGFRHLTYLPNAPKYVKGILNLRGNIIPVMDPRIKFGMDEITYDKTSVIIIVETSGKNVGIIVDNIKDVLTIDAKNIEETPQVSSRSSRSSRSSNVDSQFIEGIGKVGEKFVIILNISKIFNKEDLAKIA
ncbi:MAG: purine-binding chemotaxis protein CheW [Oligoflexia bacterium]|nr:purine-binding chemotaxis protein CheW [Oligoflexia bacterium]